MRLHFRCPMPDPFLPEEEPSRRWRGRHTPVLLALAILAVCVGVVSLNVTGGRFTAQVAPLELLSDSKGLVQTQMMRDEHGHIESIVRLGDGKAQKMEKFDSQSRPDGSFLFSYAPDGSLTAVTELDEQGNIENIAHMSGGRMVSRDEYRNGNMTGSEEFSLGSDGAIGQSVRRDAQGKVIERLQFEGGRREKLEAFERDVQTGLTEYTYGSSGSLISAVQKDPNGDMRTQFRFENGRAVSAVLYEHNQPSGSLSYSYDVEGNLLEVQKIDTAGNATETYRYGSEGTVTSASQEEAN
jgi:hypothetical protein